MATQKTSNYLQSTHSAHTYPLHTQTRDLPNQIATLSTVNSRFAFSTKYQSKNIQKKAIESMSIHRSRYHRPHCTVSATYGICDIHRIWNESTFTTPGV